MKYKLYERVLPVLAVFIQVFLISCDQKNEIPGQSTMKEITSFTLEAKNNPQLLADVTLHINDSCIFGSVPLTELSINSPLNTNFIATFKTTGAKVTVNAFVQSSGVSSNNLLEPVVYTVEALDHTTKKYTVKVTASTGLPAVFINTTNYQEIISKDDYLDGTMVIDATAKNSAWNFAGTIQIKGRGNSTWDAPKKPYKIKLTNKASMLGMPSDKEWVLLANYFDKSLMRNALAFQVSQQAGLAYSPRAQFVDLFLNGTYVGNYQLCEQIKIASTRINITEMDESDISGTAVTGGYYLEVNHLLDEEFNFVTQRGVPFSLKDPDDETMPQQYDYIKNYIQQTEDALYSNTFTDTINGYAKFINPDTFIKWYLVNELFKNNDAQFYASVFMYKDKNQKLNMGPVWDFDTAAGNANYNGNENPEGWWVRNTSWPARLFEDPAFNQNVIAQWTLLKAQLANLNTVIDQTATDLEKSQTANFQRWDILTVRLPPNNVVPGSYAGEVLYLKDWMSKRIAWMDANIGSH